MRTTFLLLALAACGAPEAPAAKQEAKVEAVKPAEAPKAPAATPAAAAPAAAPAGDWVASGAAFPADGAVIPVSQVLDAPATFAGKTVTVEGEIADVCQKKGCWMVMGDGKRTIRVTMKDHAFGIDMNSTGGKAQVFGELVAKAVDPKTVAHYASEAAKPELVPEKAGATENYELIASSVRVRKAQ